MRILAITTATRRGGAAILSDGQILGRREYEAADGHAERLFGAIDAALEAARVGRREIDALACDVGPGSFTGVRVGVAAIQGAARALRVPVVGVTSLDAMLTAAGAEEAAPLLAVLDAKKSEVFFAWRAPGLDETPSHVRLADAPRLVEIAARIGAKAIGEMASAIPGLDVVRRPDTDLPDAAWIGRCALARPLPSLGAVVEPVYVRAPDAKPTTSL
jgi:tRNA threonylcarbamoyladenosine biosynthesis protein TsaB